jgi:HlyD family secretion protein
MTPPESARSQVRVEPEYPDPTGAGHLGPACSLRNERGIARKGLLMNACSAAAAVSLAAAALGYFLSPRKDETSFQTDLAVRRTLTQAVTASGQLNPVVKVQVGSQVSGTIQKLLVDYNSVVRKGQVIAHIDPKTYEASVRQNEAELASAKAALELARGDARRYAELFAAALVSQSNHETVMSKLHQSEAAVQIKQAILERSRADLALCTIYAPIDGIVISRNVDVGQTVAASLSAPTLFQIANDLARMQVDAKVSEADIGGIRLGQTVRFTVDAFPLRTFTGKVIQVRNEAITSQNVVTYDTVIEARNLDLVLKPGMTAIVSIILAEREDALTVPNGALSFRPSQTAIPEIQPPHGSSSGPQDMRVVCLVKRDSAASGASKIVPVQIRTGITDGTHTEVLEGLNEGDEVITGELVAVRPDSRNRKTSNPFSGNIGRPGGTPPPPPPGP